MDLFVFNNYTLDSKGMVDYPYFTLEGATLIPDITSVTWVERYLEPGEFSFTVPIESAVQSMVPVGSIISQVEGQETMIVENHEIVEDDSDQIQLKVSGRSFQVILENRIMGQWTQFNYASTIGEKWNGAFGTSGYSWSVTTIDGNRPPRKSDIVEYFVNGHFGLYEVSNAPSGGIPQNINNLVYPFWPMGLEPYTYPNADTIRFLVFINYNNRPIPPQNTSYMEKFDYQKDLHTTVIETLNVESMGIKTQRAGLTSPIDFHGQGIPHQWPDHYKNKLAMVVYYANDRREAVQFSYEGGDVAKAHYLWSIKNAKNSYWINYYYGMLYRGDIGYKQRMLYVDGQAMSRADNDEAISDGNSALRRIKFRESANRELLKRENQKVATMEAQLVSQQKDLIYRRDYDTGDLVTVHGNHGFKETMQVIEYTEIEDDTGEISYPTLIIPSEQTVLNLGKPVGERI